MEDSSSSPAFEAAVTRRSLRDRHRPNETPTSRHRPNEVPVSNPSPRKAFGTVKPVPDYYHLPLTSVWSEDDWGHTMSQGIAESIRNVYEELGLNAAPSSSPFANSPVSELERDIVAAAADLVETCTTQQLIAAVLNPRSTATIIDKLVKDHGVRVWGRSLGAQAHLKTPNGKKMHMRDRLEWEVGLDRKRIRTQIRRWVFLETFECARSARGRETATSSRNQPGLVHETNLSASTRKRHANPLMRDTPKKTRTVMVRKSEVLVPSSDDEHEEGGWGKVIEISD